jgi:hypothetical protein
LVESLLEVAASRDVDSGSLRRQGRPREGQQVDEDGENGDVEFKETRGR